jgi:hypothetical protein
MLTRCFVLLSILLMSLTAEARHHNGIDISISVAPPPAQIVVAPPHGYSHCYVTRGMWVDNMWIPPHQECSNPGASQSSVWVSGYWGCVVPGRHGRCGKWKWLSHHWMRGAPPQDIHEHVHGHEYESAYSHGHEQSHDHGRADVQVHAHDQEARHEHNPTVHTR